MVSATEALNSKPPMGAALADGLRTLAANQTIRFNLYWRYVFPLDGLVYWIRVTSTPTPQSVPYPALATEIQWAGESVQVCPGSLDAGLIVRGQIDNPLSAEDQGTGTAESLFVDLTGPATTFVSETTQEIPPGASFAIPGEPSGGAWVNGMTGGHRFAATLWTPTNVPTAAPLTFDVLGSLHYASHVDQAEDAVVDVNEVVFTSLTEIQPFNQIGPELIYIAQYRDISFAFSARGRLFEQADLYHYSGQAITSINRTQIIETPDDFQPSLVVSNSLPIWLGMPGYTPFYPTFPCPIPLYPSFLAPENLAPPFGSVHIEDTQGLAAAPFLGNRMERSQLCSERVRVTMHGVDSETAQTFIDFVLQYATDWHKIGLRNMPVVVDERHTQPELRIVSQKKHVDFEINYLQHLARDEARQLIEKARCQFVPAEFTV
jgi:hypothetical protein